MTTTYYYLVGLFAALELVSDKMNFEILLRDVVLKGPHPHSLLKIVRTAHSYPHSFKMFFFYDFV